MATKLMGCKAKMPRNLEIPPLTLSTRSSTRKRHASGQDAAPVPHHTAELQDGPRHQEDTATDTDSGVAEEQSISETASVRIQL